MPKKNARITYRCPSELRHLIEKEAEIFDGNMSDAIVNIVKTWFYRRPIGDADRIFREINELVANFQKMQSRSGTSGIS